MANYPPFLEPGLPAAKLITPLGAAIAVDSLLEPRSKPATTECFCGVELEAGLCPNGHDPVALVPPSPTDARELVTEWWKSVAIAATSEHLDDLARRVTTFANQRYMEGLKAAAKAVGSVFKAAHTYSSENADDYHRFDDGQRYAINNALAAIRALLNREK